MSSNTLQWSATRCPPPPPGEGGGSFCPRLADEGGNSKCQAWVSHFAVCRPRGSALRFGPPSWVLSFKICSPAPLPPPSKVSKLAVRPAVEWAARAFRGRSTSAGRRRSASVGRRGKERVFEPFLRHFPWRFHVSTGDVDERDVHFMSTNATRWEITL